MPIRGVVSSDQAKLMALRDAVAIGVDAIEQGDFREFAAADEMVAYLTAATNDLFEAQRGDDA